MAIICPDLKLLFIMVPGTGCSAVGRTLRKGYGGQFLPERAAAAAAPGASHKHKHNTVGDLLADGWIDREQLRDHLVVATVRNPFDRLVTYYQRLAGDWFERSITVARRNTERLDDELGAEARARRMKALEARHAHYRRKHRLLQFIGFNPWVVGTTLRQLGRQQNASRADFLFPMLEGVDVVLRTEQLEAGLREVLALAGAAPGVSLRRKNTTPGKRPYTDYYNAVSRGLLTALFRRELAQFGYTFDACVAEQPLLWLNPSHALHRPATTAA